jgi:pyridoxal phosphate enzyme (YggS family)
MTMAGVLTRLAEVKTKIAAAAKDAERDPGAVTLVAVTKTFAATDILPVLEAGHRVFGENRVQEAKGKWPALRDRFPDIALHLIGPLQTNKVKEAVALFDVIESVDRPKLASALAAEMAKTGRRLPCFVQVNTGAEPQKAGILPKETAAFVESCRAAGLAVAGLMCIPPLDDEAALHFALLRKLANESGLSGLSMGMSGDYPTAILLGATHVRVGSAIFGARG